MPITNFFKKKDPETTPIYSKNPTSHTKSLKTHFNKKLLLLPLATLIIGCTQTTPNQPNLPKEQQGTKENMVLTISDEIDPNLTKEELNEKYENHPLIKYIRNLSKSDLDNMGIQDIEKIIKIMKGTVIKVFKFNGEDKKNKDAIAYSTMNLELFKEIKAFIKINGSPELSEQDLNKIYENIKNIYEKNIGIKFSYVNIESESNITINLNFDTGKIAGTSEGGTGSATPIKDKKDRTNGILPTSKAHLNISIPNLRNQTTFDEFNNIPDLKNYLEDPNQYFTEKNIEFQTLYLNYSIPHEINHPLAFSGQNHITGYSSYMNAKLNIVPMVYKEIPKEEGSIVDPIQILIKNAWDASDTKDPATQILKVEKLWFDSIFDSIQDNQKIKSKIETKSNQINSGQNITKWGYSYVE